MTNRGIDHEATPARSSPDDGVHVLWDSIEQQAVRWTRSARVHRLGRAHALAVMRASAPVTQEGRFAGEELLYWRGTDDRELELEIVAVKLADNVVLVIHVMPTALRRRT